MLPGLIEKPAGGDQAVQAVEIAPIAPEPAPAEVSQASPPSPALRTWADRRRLIFGTIFIDSPPKKILIDQWLSLNRTLNPDCDLLLVDSASPIRDFLDEARHGAFERHEPGKRAPLLIHDFGDNIGHLSRGGRDGWGRAFCYGLEAAISGGYEYVAHVEGDSLCRLSFERVFDWMARDRIEAMTAAVQSGARVLPRWVETGLMTFSTEFLKRSELARRYDWPHRTTMPTPEVVLGDLLRGQIKIMGWRAYRADKDRGHRAVSHANVVQHGFDWITHFHDDIWAYDRFFEAAMAGREPPAPIALSQIAAEQSIVAEPVKAQLLFDMIWLPPEKREDPQEIIDRMAPLAQAPAELSRPLVKINLGCGTNRLAGWENHDADVDITKPLPWPDDSADFIFIEHCVEHVPYRQAHRFFEEALRVLKPGGVLRVTVPSIEQIAAADDEDYWRFTTKFQKVGPTKAGALHAIIHCHGHECGWTASLMSATLLAAGFDRRIQRKPGESEHEALRGVEGHGKVIGDRFNDLESMCFEATKPGALIFAPSFEAAKNNARPDVAIIVGGARGVLEDVARAIALCKKAGVEPEFFAVNDMIALWPGECVAVTVSHGQRMPGKHGGLRATPHGGPGWLDDREARGYPAPTDVYCMHAYPSVTKVLNEWNNGSSGLYAIRVARERGHDRIIGCGMPMEEMAGHHVESREQIWVAAGGFRDRWTPYMPHIEPCFRSLSGGWTGERFGEPTVEFLRGAVKQAAE